MPQEFSYPEATLPHRPTLALKLALLTFLTPHA